MSQEPRHSLAVTTGRHNRVAGGQRGLREIDAHAAAGTRDQPDLLAHRILTSAVLFAEPLNAVGELGTVVALIGELCDRESEWLQIPRDS